MKFPSVAVLAIVVAIFGPSSVRAQEAVPGTEILVTEEGLNGFCYDDSGFFDWGNKGQIKSSTECHDVCQLAPSDGLLGFSYSPLHDHCVCKYDDGTLPVSSPECGGVFDACSDLGAGEGPLEYVSTDGLPVHKEYICYKYLQSTQGTGDPHCEYNTNE